MLTPQQIWLVCEPMDMRKGVNTLTLITQALFKDAWQQGSTFVFRNRSGCRLKLLSWDQHGVWLCYQCLHQGRFIWPKAEDTSWTLTQAQFDWLIIGVDWQRLSAPKVQWQIF